MTLSAYAADNTDEAKEEVARIADKSFSEVMLMMLIMMAGVVLYLLVKEINKDAGPHEPRYWSNNKEE